MSQSRRRKREFLTENPICCFCGGRAPAEQPDHVPSRAFFRERQWPEGYEFPACARCNQATRYDERVVALLSRMYPDGPTESDKTATRKLMAAVARHDPAVLHELQLTARQRRRAAEEYDLAPRPGKARGDLPLVRLGGPLIRAAMLSFSRKLFCALYYKHSRHILGPTGGAGVRWYSNLRGDKDEILRDLIVNHMSRSPKLERSRTNLDDQFYYRWEFVESAERAVFFAVFRQSFGILGFVFQQLEELEWPSNAVIVRPYEHQH